MGCDDAAACNAVKKSSMLQASASAVIVGGTTDRTDPDSVPVGLVDLGGPEQGSGERRKHQGHHRHGKKGPKKEKNTKTEEGAKKGDEIPVEEEKKGRMKPADGDAMEDDDAAEATKEQVGLVDLGGPEQGSGERRKQQGHHRHGKKGPKKEKNTKTEEGAKKGDEVPVEEEKKGRMKPADGDAMED